VPLCHDDGHAFEIKIDYMISRLCCHFDTTADMYFAALF
jgi:hypothetical protein